MSHELLSHSYNCEDFEDVSHIEAEGDQTEATETHIEADHSQIEADDDINGQEVRTMTF